MLPLTRNGWGCRLAEQVPTDIFGTVGGDALEVELAEGTARVALADMRRAHAALASAFA